MSIGNKFWKATVNDIKKGYIYDETTEVYSCLICGDEFEKGIIYQVNDKLMDAEKAVKNHITVKHSSMFEFLLNMDKKYTGLTDHQRNLLLMFYNGLKDKEIVDETGGGSESTIRNQRFIFREKEKQAKIFLSIMELLNEQKTGKRINEEEELIDIHRGATMIDERYAITESERQSVLKAHLAKDNKLISFPVKEKKKVVILQHIAKSFDQNKKYSEKEVNVILKSIYEDYATVRRYMIEYGFLERTVDCSEYWVKK
jgi:hypothetical protein